MVLAKADKEEKQHMAVENMLCCFKSIKGAKQWIAGWENRKDFEIELLSVGRGLKIE